MNKFERLKALGRKRKRSRWPHYKRIGEYHKGKYECAFVSPYTKSANNFDSPIMVLLQDWSSDTALRGKYHKDCAELGYGTTVPTNMWLITLLKLTYKKSLTDVFATNIFPFIKKGGMSTHIPRCDLVRAAKEYAIKQIEIVRPKLVICLGLQTFQALQIACALKPAKSMTDAIQNPFDWRKTRSRIWCQYHTGMWGQIKRGRKQMASDWRRMKKDVPIKE